MVDERRTQKEIMSIALRVEDRMQAGIQLTAFQLAIHQAVEQVVNKPQWQEIGRVVV